MTHQLAEELRKLVNSPFCAVCNRPRHDCEDAYEDEIDHLKHALRQAAEALDEAMVNLSKARTELCYALSKDGMAEVYAERDSLKTQLEDLKGSLEEWIADFRHLEKAHKKAEAQVRRANKLVKILCEMDAMNAAPPGEFVDMGGLNRWHELEENREKAKKEYLGEEDG